VQVGEQVGHLLGCKATVKGRHHSFSREHNGLNLEIGCRRAAGKGRLREEAVKIGRNLLQAKVVLLVAVSAPDLVEVLAFQLLGREFGF
jgi:hypothetical protein